MGEKCGLVAAACGERCNGVSSNILSSLVASERTEPMVMFRRVEGGGLACVTVLDGLGEPISPSLEF